MGMFDAPQTFAEHFQEGQPFQLEDAKVGPPIRTDFGTDSPVLLKIGDDWFSIFGMGLRMQVERMEPSDLPARVQIVREDTRSGQKVKRIVPVDGATQATIATEGGE